MTSPSWGFSLGGVGEQDAALGLGFLFHRLDDASLA